MKSILLASTAMIPPPVVPVDPITSNVAPGDGRAWNDMTASEIAESISQAFGADYQRHADRHRFMSGLRSDGAVRVVWPA